MNKNYKKKIRLLRISYWVGAIIDGIFVLPMVFPAIAGKLYAIENFNPSGDYLYSMAVGAALMIGWTALLIWADRKPLERRGVLLLTIVPVKVCLTLADIYLLVYDIVSVKAYILTCLESFIVYALFIFSYVYTRDIAKEYKDQKKLKGVKTA